MALWLGEMPLGRAFWEFAIAYGTTANIVATIAAIGAAAASLPDTLVVEGRIRIAVPRIGVGEQAATTLALVIHELATNSLKYGALSTNTGLLDISGEEEPEALTLKWVERGGSEIVEAPSQEGFGRKLVERSISQQLGGSIHADWLPEGAVVTLRVSKSRLSL